MIAIYQKLKTEKSNDHLMIVAGDFNGNASRDDTSAGFVLPLQMPVCKLVQSKLSSWPSKKEIVELGGCIKVVYVFPGLHQFKQSEEFMKAICIPVIVAALFGCSDETANTARSEAPVSIQSEKPANDQNCAELEKIVDPAERKELASRCLRRGEFKASPEVSY